MASSDDDEVAERCYDEARAILVSLREKFAPHDAGTVLLCALGRLAAIQRVPQKQAWRTITSAGCRAGFRFGYLNQAEQLKETNPPTNAAIVD